ncbi:MAG: hypothetical protein EZS28_011895 [Streblomastix strix]|uniref:Uncharacterized protein n=1 Tax=Streblomastix strix TaxID=222440 RepID=A0A5J4WC94_9EUKA|nr:MAG: hypothetical protein EZS28_011895 [Streblomastix strix]
MGDYAYSAEDQLVWVYENNWIETDQLVPDQVTPASDVIPSNSIVNGSAGVSTEYSRGDHQHPLQVSTVLPAKDTATGEVGEANIYARSDHTHHVNLSNDIPLKDTATGTGGTSNLYASAKHQHPLNVDPNSVIVPLVNATAAANGTSDYYSRNDHVHPQQLTYDGNVTATKFIKTGGTNQQILLVDGTNKSIIDFNTSVAPREYQIDPADGIYWILSGILEYKTDKIQDLKLLNQLVRLMASGQYQKKGDGSLTIVRTADQYIANRGLVISVDGNTLSFNGSAIADTGATMSQTPPAAGSVNYSAGNPILWGVNNAGTEGGFYSDGAKVYWRAKPITLGSVPP